jgi:hypothetical protein
MNKNLLLSYICCFILISGFLFQTSGCRLDEKPVCDGPIPHVPDWKQSKFTNIQVGDSVKFIYNGVDILSEDMGIYWEFENGVPGVSDQPVVWVKYNIPGCWKVRLEMHPKCEDQDRPFEEIFPAVCIVE